MVIEHIPEIVVPGKRLGRHINHSARLAARPHPMLGRTLVSVEHARHIPILDQGDVGSCTGNATVGSLGTTPVYEALPVNHRPLDEQLAVQIYSDAEVIDGDGPYPPNDNGSTGPSVGQVAVSDGYAAKFDHYTDIDSTLQALQDDPVMLGMNWYSSFDTPDANGVVVISRGAYVRGGHEVVARGYDAAKQMIKLDNSWGTSWGVNGSFYMSAATLKRLLIEGGDATVLRPLAPVPVPVPVPTPTPPPPGPVPPGPKPPWWDEFVKWLADFYG